MMEAQEQGLLAHPQGEQPMVEGRSATADTFAGRVHIEWDETAPVTPPGATGFLHRRWLQVSLFLCNLFVLGGCEFRRFLN